MPTPPTPTNTQLFLMNVPFDSAYRNVLDFKNEEEKLKYFTSRILKIKQYDGTPLTLKFSDCQYCRKDGTLKIPVHIDKLYNCNYLAFKNTNFSDRIFYCFVTGQRYVNDNCTQLNISTDVFTTWGNVIKIHDSFVEREHTNDDTVGNNLLPEGLETGEFIINDYYDMQDYLEPVGCLAFLGNKIGNVTIETQAGYYNGIPSSIPFIGFPIHSINGIMNAINGDGNGDKIFSCFSIPKLAVYDKYNEYEQNQGLRDFFFTFPLVQFQKPLIVFESSKLYSLNGYFPNNNKLLTYPYCYLGFNAPNGTSKIYRYENFKGDTIRFKGRCEINPNPTVLITPQDYIIYGENVQQSSSINGYPMLSYRNDYFNTWLAQNSNTINLAIDQSNLNYAISQNNTALSRDREMFNATTGLMSSFASGLASAITGNFGGLISSAFGAGTSMVNSDFNMRDIQLQEWANQSNWQYELRNINAQVEKQQLLPDTASLSSSNGTLLGYNLHNKCCFAHFSIKYEQAKRIDQYFTMFGYQTNEVKKPNLRGRKNWNYVKTVNINITGDIPITDIETLKSIFNNGVTIWHNPNTIYDYKNDNSIVG